MVERVTAYDSTTSDTSTSTAIPRCTFTASFGSEGWLAGSGGLGRRCRAYVPNIKHIFARSVPIFLLPAREFWLPFTPAFPEARKRTVRGRKSKKRTLDPC